MILESIAPGEQTVESDHFDDAGTEESYAAQVHARREKGLQRRAEELGYELKKIAPSAE